jgi:uncharacterized protein YndB with AHSA1/START domain
MTSDITDRTLVLTRLIDATPEKLFRCWTEPELIRQWFAPKPWTTPFAELDLRVGGRSETTMADENGVEYPNVGQYLEIVPNEKIVFTDGFVGGWVPSERPFFTCELTFKPEGGKTRYTAKAMHWSKDDRDAHERMGFYEGWGLCATQLEDLAKTL